MSKILVVLIIFFISSAPVFGAFVHLEYDWEGDNANEKPPTDVLESCYPCHYGAMAAIGVDKPRKKCEDCHLVNATTGMPNGPYKYYQMEGDTNFSLREDYTSPLVYSHIKVRIPSSYSTCLNYDEETGEGICHGVSNEFGDELDGHFAFNQTQNQKMSRDYPYLLSVSKGFLPNSTDCLYCHFQTNRKLAKAWGGAPQVIPLLHARLSDIKGGVQVNCIDCHLEEGSVLVDFHSAGIILGMEEEKGTYQNIGVLIALFLILSAAGAWVFRKFLSKKREISPKEED